MIPGNQFHAEQEISNPQGQRTSVDLLSDLDLSAGASTQPFGEDGSTSRFPISSASQSSTILSPSPKLAYSHPSRQAGKHPKISKSLMHFESVLDVVTSLSHLSNRTQSFRSFRFHIFISTYYGQQHS